MIPKECPPDRASRLTKLRHSLLRERDGVRGSYTAALQKEFINSCRRKATWRVAPGEEIVEGIIREIFQKAYKSVNSAQ